MVELIDRVHGAEKSRPLRSHPEGHDTPGSERLDRASGNPAGTAKCQPAAPALGPAAEESTRAHQSSEKTQISHLPKSRRSNEVFTGVRSRAPTRAAAYVRSSAVSERVRVVAGVSGNRKMLARVIGMAA